MTEKMRRVKDCSIRLVSRTLVITLVVLCVLLAPERVFSEQTEAQLWKALRSGGHVALMRHALAPGIGDPEDFTLRDCSTQRNLSEEGRAQAQRIGKRFRANGIQEISVYSSQWCRCLETARLLELGSVNELPALNSFYQRFERSAVQTEEIKKWLVRQELRQPLVLVTHQVNINALTDAYTSSGEMVVVRVRKSGDLSVLGSIRTD
jgi:phosphohistidine phosphatase SixA